MSDFFTREAANEGIKIPIPYPDGRESEQWLLIRGADSDMFRTADAIARRRIVETMQSDQTQAEKATALETIQRKAQASLVIDWNLTEEATLGNIEKLFREAPYIADLVDRKAGNRSLFLGESSANSTSSPKEKSR